MVATPYAMLPGIVYLLSLRHCESFSFSESPRKPEAPTNTDGSTRKNLDRREWLSGVVFASGILTGAGNARADGIDVSSIQMKEFVDPQGLFSITVPNDFYTIRRQAKGDLPDAKGKGRRGSSIFTAGNMAKAEVIAVERFPTRVLLEENGIEATGELKTFPDIGEPAAVANLINLRREKDRPGQSNTALISDSLKLSSDGSDLFFALKTEIEVQKPELLMEQYGVSQLFRITTVKASLRSADGNLMAAFASALEQDFKGPDGDSLQASVDSFKPMEREFGF